MEIRFQAVDKAYAGRAVLRKLDWRLRTGEGWRLEGVSGIGKTTVLRLLMGLALPDAGQITGQAGVRMTAVFQEHRLCPWLSARQNLRLVCPQEVTDAQIEQALCALLPADCLGQPAGTLSGGMQRRVAIVRAFLPASELVLLDEPFAGLDAENVARTLAFMEKQRQGRALVLVSHEAYYLPDMPHVLRL